MAESTAVRVPADLLDERLIQEKGLGGVAKVFWNRLRGGELGSLPVVIGLVVICAVFYAQDPRFLSSYTLVSMTQFAAPIGIISLGIVLVLLLGQIDLSVGSVSGFASACMAVWVVSNGHHPFSGLLLGIGVGVVVGLLYAVLYTRVGVPSFVFSLAGLLAFKGALLFVLGDQGTVNLPADSALVQFAKFGFVDPVVSYALVGLLVLGYLGAQLVGRRRRSASGLSTGPVSLLVVRTALLGGGLLWVTWYLNVDRGWSWLWVLFASLVIVMDLLLRKSRWGRHVYAVGGNVEAARRSGIKVDRIYLTVFVLCSSFAALGGIMSAGLLSSVSQSSGTNALELTVISAAVIGGASLFGGRGTAYAAMLGVIVLQAIESGLNIVNVDSSVRFMVTGAVLLLAVAIDSMSRRARTHSGRG